MCITREYSNHQVKYTKVAKFFKNIFFMGEYVKDTDSLAIIGLGSYRCHGHKLLAPIVCGCYVIFEFTFMVETKTKQKKTMRDERKCVLEFIDLKLLQKCIRFSLFLLNSTME